MIITPVSHIRELAMAGSYPKRLAVYGVAIYGEHFVELFIGTLQREYRVSANRITHYAVDEYDAGSIYTITTDLTPLLYVNYGRVFGQPNKSNLSA